MHNRNHNLSNQELATILAALRYYCEQGLADEPRLRSDAIHDIATGGEKPDFCASLDSEAVDKLCQRLNFGDAARSSGCYLKLFHGRSNPEEQLEDWGFEGPVIGPISLSLTYKSLKVHSPEGDEFEFLPWHEDLIAYDGVYYGDAALFIEGDEALENLQREGAVFHTYDKFQATLHANAS